MTNARAPTSPLPLAIPLLPREANLLSAAKQITSTLSVFRHNGFLLGLLRLLCQGLKGFAQGEGESFLVNE